MRQLDSRLQAPRHRLVSPAKDVGERVPEVGVDPAMNRKRSPLPQRLMRPDLVVPRQVARNLPGELGGVAISRW